MKNGNAGGNALSSNIPIPMGMFVNMSHIPPRFFNKQQQAMQQQNYGIYIMITARMITCADFGQ